MPTDANIWSEKELKILTDNITLEVIELVKLLPGKSKDAVRSKKRRLKFNPKNNKVLLNQEKPPVNEKQIIQKEKVNDLKKDIILSSNISLDDFNDEIEKLEIVHKERLKNAKDNHFTEVRELERNHENAVTELKKLHKLEITNLERKYFSKLDSLETNNRSKYKELTNRYNSKLADLNRYHETTISSVKEKYNISKDVLKVSDTVPVNKEKKSNIITYDKAIEEFDKISKTINQSLLLDEKQLIIGEVIYLSALEKNINVRKNIKNGIIQALMTKPDKYWTGSGHLKLEHWIERLRILGESTNFKESA